MHHSTAVALTTSTGALAAAIPPETVSTLERLVTGIAVIGLGLVLEELRSAWRDRRRSKADADSGRKEA